MPEQPSYHAGQSGPFHEHGYFETVIEDLTGRVLGNRLDVTPEPGRVIGFNGQRIETWTANVTLNRGHRDIVVKASPKKPLKVRTIVFPKSGPIKWRHPLEGK